MRQILRVTRFGALRHSPGAPLDPRFVNRATGVLWILAGLLGVVLFLLTRSPWLLLLIGMPPLLRWMQFTARGIRHRRSYRLGERELLILGVHGLLADVAYAIGLVSPVPRPKRTPAPVAAI